MSGNPSTPPDDRVVEAMLRGKALQIYWLFLERREPLGVREIQKALSFSSPSVVHHHLEKLGELGLVDQDQYSRYVLARKVDVGILHAFSRIGGLMLPRFLFYAVFSASLLGIYLAIYGPPYNLFALAFGAGSTIFTVYETVRAWKRRPF